MESQPPPGSPAPGSLESGIKNMYKGMLNVQENTLLTVLLLSSAVELFAGVGMCNAYNICSGYFGWAVSVGKCCDVAISLAGHR